MITDVARYWWIFLIRGLAAVAFGIGAWVWPGLTIAVLVALFGAYALVDGIFSLAAAFQGGRTSRWLPLLIGGIGGIALGLVTMIWPGLTATTVLYLIAAWAIVGGISQIVAAVRLRRVIEREGLLVVAGIGAVLWGLFVAIFPGDGAVALVWTIGLFAIVFGVLLIGLALRLRGWRDSGSTGTMDSGPEHLPTRVV